MAKIDWSKHKHLKLKGDAFKDLPIGGYRNNFYRENNLWTLTGKYLGTHIHKLPLHYLNWAVDNLKSQQHRQQAIDEIYRRHGQLLTHKVSGPDNNTAVEKLGK
jgi:hypothetical protein